MICGEFKVLKGIKLFYFSYIIIAFVWTGLRERPRGNLDPNLPMMQLFLGTILPWNDIDTEANNHN